MDVFEAIDSRIACRWFLDSPVDPKIVRELIEKAARAPSNGNLQPWNVHAVAGAPLSQIKRRAAEIIKINEWDKLETVFPMAPENLWEPYLGRRVQHGAQLYGAMAISRDNPVERFEQIKRNVQFFNAPVALFMTIDRGLGPGQWADLGGYVSSLAVLARGYGLDTCPQIIWIYLHKLVSEFLNFPAEQMLYCGMGIGYRDESWPANQIRSHRADLNEFCTFVGFD